MLSNIYLRLVIVGWDEENLKYTHTKLCEWSHPYQQLVQSVQKDKVKAGQMESKIIILSQKDRFICRSVRIEKWTNQSYRAHPSLSCCHPMQEPVSWACAAPRAPDRPAGELGRPPRVKSSPASVTGEHLS